ncbi:quinoprotein relay system zinc metallohydrolase 1 [Caldimonas sp. KR1-144]|uniref:quinoprotein relay system zinc metallohydrolase 1 n=1 Tax=Caldimonas sp. KR1-144 TaxID=3400911 RepID=UPI003C02902F
MRRALAIWLLAATALRPALAADAATLDYRLAARSLAPGVWVVEGANADFAPANGCNIINTGFIATGAGVVVVNTGPSRRYGEQLRALIARTTGEPVVQVLQLNLHPDYFLGNQAFADVPRTASATTREGVAREAAAYETNLYRLCGEWMKGTQALAPDATLDTSAGRGMLRVGERELEWHALAGHTASDLVLVDRASGVAFVGGLVFHERVPTTPHADVAAWLASLNALDALKPTAVVPSHGPVSAGAAGIAQTRRYLQWLDAQFTQWAEQGLDIHEVLRAPVPDEFRAWAAFASEYPRNVSHLYPRYEQRALGRH